MKYSPQLTSPYNRACPCRMDNTPGLGDKFFVAVSEDGGNTWKKENTTWWSDDTEDNAAFSYASIPLEDKLRNFMVLF